MRVVFQRYLPLIGEQIAYWSIEARLVDESSWVRLSTLKLIGEFLDVSSDAKNVAGFFDIGADPLQRNFSSAMSRAESASFGEADGVGGAGGVEKGSRWVFGCVSQLYSSMRISCARSHPVRRRGCAWEDVARKWSFLEEVSWSCSTRSSNSSCAAIDRRRR